MAYNYYNNQPMINQLMRYKDNIDNMISQMNAPQQPIQNIINTGTGLEFEARILKDDEEVENVYISRRTMFLDKKNKKLIIKETDGKISEEYEIVLPKDAKDLKIEELENKIKEMEVKFNEYSKSNISNDVEQKSNANDVINVKSSTKTSGESIPKSD